MLGWNCVRNQKKAGPEVDKRGKRARTPEKIDAFAPQKPKWKPKEEDVK